MYTFLNVIQFGLKNLPIKDDSHAKAIINKMDESLRLDFLSGIYFRVFENLVSQQNDPERFKLEIIINNGATLNSDNLNRIDDHRVPIYLEETYSDSLTLEDLN